MSRWLRARLVAIWARRLVPRPPESTRKFPTGGFKIIDTAIRVEEEALDHYTPGSLYAVRIGEVLRSRYQVIGKLGFGCHSTAWLCRDLKHPGKIFVRTLLDHFELQGQGGHAHTCLVHEPLALSAETVRLFDPEGKLEPVLAKVILNRMLHALDFLHTEAGIVHGDLQTMNVHCGLQQDDRALKVFEEQAIEKPVDRKIDGEYITYRSQGMIMPEKLGQPILCDFGEARMDRASYNELLQPIPYRSPEVILGIPWTYSTDIWNVAAVAWVMVEGKLLCTGRDHDGEPSYSHHLAQMVALLGLPPKSLLERSSVAAKYFDEKGELLDKHAYVRATLDHRILQLKGDEKAQFLAFIRKMLCWVPEERQTAGQLARDSWVASFSQG